MKRPRFHVYQDEASLWRWRLVTVNGRTIADSGEGYTRQRDVRRAIRVVRAAAMNAKLT